MPSRLTAEGESLSVSWRYGLYKHGRLLRTYFRKPSEFVEAATPEAPRQTSRGPHLWRLTKPKALLTDS